MEETSNEPILIRIKKLLALSGNNTNEHEAAEAASKAQELLIRYNLSAESLDEINIEKKEPLTRQSYTKHKTGKNEARWKVDLSFIVARANLCEVLHTAIPGGRNYIEWFGTPSNIEVAQYLFETLCYDLEKIADTRWQQLLELRKLQNQYPSIQMFTDPELMWVHGKSWKASFFQGAIDVIRIRLNQGVDSLKKDPNLNALITTNDQAVAKYIDNLYPKLGSGYKGGNISALSGYAAGKAAGEKIQFKRGINGAGGAAGPHLLRG